MKNRSRTEITNMILDSARTGATKTRMMYKAYLSYAQVMEYLEYLQQNDLLTYEAGTQLYKPTEKGFRFLKISDELSEMTLFTNLKNYDT
jgi:predicted transcriptional regulator